jgi:hypothetical protein
MTKKIVTLCLILILTAGYAFTAVITVKEVIAKVEVRRPGETAWQKAEVGMELPLESSISTGFRSMAVLDLGTSEIQVMQLTRMSVEELMEQQDSVSTSLLLDAGKIRADVKTSVTRTHDFTVTSPVATASVRGTSFVFDGFSVQVLAGTVNYFNRIGERVTVAEGTESKTVGTTTPTPPAEELVKVTEVKASTEVEEVVTETLETAVETTPVEAAETLSVDMTVE